MALRVCPGTAIRRGNTRRNCLAKTSAATVPVGKTAGLRSARGRSASGLQLRNDDLRRSAPLHKRRHCHRPRNSHRRRRAERKRHPRLRSSRTPHCRSGLVATALRRDQFDQPEAIGRWSSISRTMRGGGSTCTGWISMASTSCIAPWCRANVIGSRPIWAIPGSQSTGAAHAGRFIIRGLTTTRTSSIRNTGSIDCCIGLQGPSVGPCWFQTQFSGWHWRPAISTRDSLRRRATAYRIKRLGNFNAREAL
jgi:hypothetical protein